LLIKNNARTMPKETGLIQIHRNNALYNRQMREEGGMDGMKKPLHKGGRYSLVKRKILEGEKYFTSPDARIKRMRKDERQDVANLKG